MKIMNRKLILIEKKLFYVKIFNFIIAFLTKTEHFIKVNF